MKIRSIWKNRDFIILAIVLLILAGGTVFFFNKDMNTATTTESFPDAAAAYPAEEEIAAAKARLAQKAKPAALIVNDAGGDNAIALVFDGLPERPLAARLTDLMNKYNVQAAFFVEGHNACDAPHIVQLFVSGNQTVGNFTFAGIAAAEKLLPEKLINEVCRTQKILSVVTGKTPKLFRAQRTRYTPSLLRTLGATDIEAAVHADVFFPQGAIRTAADADAFVATLKPGNIVAVTLGTPVEVTPWGHEQTAVTDKKPTIKDVPSEAGKKPAVNTASTVTDKKPTVKDGTEVAGIPDRPMLIDELERVLVALQKRGLRVKPVESFRKEEPVENNG